MIYCVEDDAGIRELMIYTLQASDLQAKGLPDADAFWAAMEKEKPKLILLDIMLPGEDGISILKKLKAQSTTADIPVIMATAKGTEYDKVIGLDLGADDYLAKPFGMMEMVSRVKAVLRRAYKDEKTDIVAVGKLTLNPQTHTVRADGEKVILTLKEFELLHKFMRHPGRVYSREQLLSDIWGADYVGETRTVDVHIGTLRTKLGECGEYIDTVRGVGYRLEEKNNG
ncbi:MAG: winged helix-turn-helix domain-containing protein [Clostridium sp.]|jgi:two-component system alkaline phosphatase synthesis response regulator PhoP|nr:winged helix-turn-helix domain-containing protein [Clostridium sp.]MDD6179640.1 winged helix-turn-helix domain-containing protein [Clostridium sp.]CDA68967.1 two-component system OmpR family phosphate regulon response regulator [Clostridium sp. CAG:510]